MGCSPQLERITPIMQNKIADLVNALMKSGWIDVESLSKFAEIFTGMSVGKLMDDDYILKGNDLVPDVSTKKPMLRLKLDEIAVGEDDESRRVYLKRSRELADEFSDPKRSGFILKYLLTEIEVLMILRELRVLRLRKGSSAFIQPEYKMLMDLYRVASGVHNSTGDRFELNPVVAKAQSKEDKMIMDAVATTKQRKEEEELLKKQQKDLM